MLNGRFSVGDFTVTLGVIGGNGAKMIQIHGALLTVFKSVSSVKGVASFLRLEVDTLARKKELDDRKKEHNIERDKASALRNSFPEGSAMKKTPLRDMMFIKLFDVHVRYGENLVLTNCTAQLRQETLTAIVGPHSSGKATLIKVFIWYHCA